MKKLTLLCFLCLSKFIVNGQTIPSSCFAPDSIKSQYIDDADRLALRKIYRQQLTSVDSVVIPQNHSDTVLNALIAVYNATTLPARDTVVSMFNIHTFPNPVLNSILVAADSTLAWMEQLELGIIPTGNASIDTLISKYNLSVSNYYDFGNSYYYHLLVFDSDSNYNLNALVALFESNVGVYYSEGNGYGGDGNNIWDSIYSDHVELIYSVGLGDCPAGCTVRRFWKFNVYFDCSVEFVGSYGAILEFAGTNEIQKPNASIYPNPFTDQLTFDNTENEKSTVSLFDFSGEQILQQSFINSTTIKTEGLSKGIYFYQLIDSTGKVINGKVVKD
jgi:hypothetical protein